MKLQSWLRTIGQLIHQSNSNAACRSDTIPLGMMRMEERQVLSATGGEVMLFSVAGQEGLNLPSGEHADSADIIQYDGSDFEILFDGSDVGLEGTNLDAFAVAGENEFLFSFATETTIEGAGTFGAADVVHFQADSLGESTSGQFSLFAGASDLGLTAHNANIDALDIQDDGTLIFSNLGNINLPIGSVGKEDFVQITPDASGSYANGTMQLFFDGSDVGLGSLENTNAVSVEGSQVHLSTPSTNFINSQGLSGSGDDVLTFSGSSFGENTAGTFALTFDGSVELDGLRFNLNALDYAEISQPSNPPSADDVSVTLDEDNSTQIQLLGDDGDPDLDQTLTYEIVDGPASGEIANFDAEAGTFTYTPDVDFDGTDTITYVVQEVDSNGEVLTSESATVNLQVNPVNDAPVVQIEQPQITADQNEAVVIQGIRVGDVEAEAQNAPVTVTLTTGNGVLSVADSTTPIQIDGNGSGKVTLRGTVSDINALLSQGVTFQPESDFSGDTSVVVSIRDNGGAETALESTETVLIEIRSTTKDAVTAFRERIADLVDNGELRRGIARRLLNSVRFEGRLHLIDRGLDRIDRLERWGWLDSAIADDLRDDLNAVREEAEAEKPHRRGPHRDGIDAIFAAFGRGRQFGRFRFFCR